MTAKIAEWGDGKYALACKSPNTYWLLRHGEEWPEAGEPGNALRAAAFEIAELRRELRSARSRTWRAGFNAALSHLTDAAEVWHHGDPAELRRIIEGGQISAEACDPFTDQTTTNPSSAGSE